MGDPVHVEVDNGLTQLTEHAAGHVLFEDPSQLNVLQKVAVGSVLHHDEDLWTRGALSAAETASIVQCIEYDAKGVVCFKLIDKLTSRQTKCSLLVVKDARKQIVTTYKLEFKKKNKKKKKTGRRRKSNEEKCSVKKLQD